MSQLDSIRRLQAALSERKEIEQKLGGVPHWMEELHAEHSERQLEIDALESSVDAAVTARREAEGAIEDAQAKLQHFQEQISLVRTQREYAALLTEIDSAKVSIKDLEEAAFTAMETADAARQSLASQREDFAALDERYQTELAKWEEEKPALRQRLLALDGLIVELRAEVPRGSLALFDRLISHRGGEALARLQMVTSSTGQRIWHCGACHYQVRLHLVAEIRDRQVFAQCDGCKRIFYYDENDAG